jgi:uncharacterized protein (DUF433 family)
MSRQSARITTEHHDEPHIAGSRITVQFVHDRVEGQGLDPETVADQHDLELADVYHALAYYHDHPEEMKAAEEGREEQISDASAKPFITTGPDDS